MATMNIQLEVPGTMAWTKDEFVAAIKAFASAFVLAKPAPAELVAETTVPSTVVDDVKISPELLSFVGIAATSDNRDWKERKEDYLREQFVQP